MIPSRTGWYLALLDGIYGEIVAVRVYNPFYASRENRSELVGAYIDRDGKLNVTSLSDPSICWLGMMHIPPNVTVRQVAVTSQSDGLQDARQA